MCPLRVAPAAGAGHAGRGRRAPDRGPGGARARCGWRRRRGRSGAVETVSAGLSGLRGVAEAYLAAWNRHDPGAVAGAFAPGGSYTGPDGVVLTGGAVAAASGALLRRLSGPRLRRPGGRGGLRGRAGPSPSSGGCGDESRPAGRRAADGPACRRRRRHRPRGGGGRRPRRPGVHRPAGAARAARSAGPRPAPCARPAGLRHRPPPAPRPDGPAGALSLNVLELQLPRGRRARPSASSASPSWRSWHTRRASWA